MKTMSISLSFYTAFAGFIACVLAPSVVADKMEIDLYGRLDIAYDEVDPGKADFNSHVSRIGVKGSYGLSDELSVIYQLEQKVNIVHGGTNVDDLFATRNSYIGLSSRLGKFMWGTHDTPFKKSQGKIDVFNDQPADIVGVVVGEVRATDSFFYHSPKLSGWQVQAMYIPSDSNFDSSQSASLFYATGDWSFGLGVDADTRKNNKSVSKTKVYDSYRGSVLFKPGAWKFGLLIQQSERQDIAGADVARGFVASLGYNFGKITALAQYARSDITADDVISADIGVEYYLNKLTKVYLYHHNYDRVGDFDVTSLGFQWKFRH